MTRRMVKTKPHRALMGGTIKRSKGPRGVRGVKGPDGVWRRPNPGNGDGYFVRGHRTSVAWYPTRIEAERVAKQMNYRGGQHYTVKPAGKFNDGRGAGAQRSNPSKGYNGHPSWNAWNVSLWINNDEGLYRFARELKRKLGTARAAEAFVDECGMTHTPDGAPFTVSSVKGAMRGM